MSKKPPAFIHFLKAKNPSILLSDLLRDPRGREYSLATTALVVNSGDETIVLPDDHYLAQEGDEVLLCGRSAAHRLLIASLNNPYVLHYLITGEDLPRSWILKWLSRSSGQQKMHDVSA